MLEKGFARRDRQKHIEDYYDMNRVHPHVHNLHILSLVFSIYEKAIVRHPEVFLEIIVDFVWTNVCNVFARYNEILRIDLGYVIKRKLHDDGNIKLKYDFDLNLYLVSVKVRLHVTYPIKIGQYIANERQPNGHQSTEESLLHYLFHVANRPICTANEDDSSAKASRGSPNLKILFEQVHIKEPVESL